MMKRRKGFAVLEVLLATVLLVGVITILVKSFSSSATYTNDTASAREYVPIINAIVTKFYTEGFLCGMSACNTCSFSDTQMASGGNVSATSYLGISSSAAQSFTDQGLDLDKILVTTCRTDLSGGSCPDSSPTTNGQLAAVMLNISFSTATSNPTVEAETFLQQTYNNLNPALIDLFDISQNNPISETNSTLAFVLPCGSKACMAIPSPS
jgi:hypothetical protein